MASGKSQKKVAIIQSNYIPWKGYFDIINSVDEFILYDDAQYTRRDWRNRNKIKSQKGATWLTIPVHVKGRYIQKIFETEVSGGNWAKKHWGSIRHNYSKAPHVKTIAPFLSELYEKAAGETRLSRINYIFIQSICQLLDVKTTLSWSMDYDPGDEMDPTGKLVRLCRKAGASNYLSGPAANAYLDEGRFEEHGICVSWMDYSGYPEYRQLYPPFDHWVSIVDLLMNEGVEGARNNMLSFFTRTAPGGPGS